jgi:hypothetical protein
MLGAAAPQFTGLHPEERRRRIRATTMTSRNPEASIHNMAGSGAEDIGSITRPIHGARAGRKAEIRYRSIERDARLALAEIETKEG